MGDIPDDAGHPAADGTANGQDGPREQPLNERLLDLFVFLPTGLAIAVAEELPRLAERGRERLGVQVNSARAVGHFAVKAGASELTKRTGGLKRSATSPAGGRAGTTPTTDRTATARSEEPVVTGPPRLRTIPFPPGRPAPEAYGDAPVVAPEAAPPRGIDDHVPDVASLAIPGFDTLSASQVVQRLDGLNRTELVATRAYETSTRGRRTILSRVDQLLDQRS